MSSLKIKTIIFLGVVLCTFVKVCTHRKLKPSVTVGVVGKEKALPDATYEC